MTEAKHTPTLVYPATPLPTLDDINLAVQFLYGHYSTTQAFTDSERQKINELAWKNMMKRQVKQ